MWYTREERFCVFILWSILSQIRCRQYTFKQKRYFTGHRKLCTFTKRV
uniref:Uncharacterized protein n=1 Tax=Anguilla anguilla TaxID=7936 RepID=A0A0E9XWX0_ANGAN